MRKPVETQRNPPHQRYVLKLYITGATRRSQRAITNLNSICEEYLQGNCDVEVVDVYHSPTIAKAANVIAAPTLVKQLPLPMRRLIGDLSERGRVLVLLDLKPKSDTK